MLIILTAVTKRGQTFIPANYSQEKLREIKESTSFLCMQCQEEVILKNGVINIPHFAHKRKSDCSHSFSEAETEDHLIGKLQLYKFFQDKNVQAQLETFIPTIKQRPDILIQSDQHLFAIEFQCSQISASVILDRSNGYMKESIIPIWILRTPSKTEFPSQEIGKMQLSAFRQQFFTIHPRLGKIIITFCPQTKYFHYISNVLHIQANTYIIKTKKLAMNNQSWPFALVKCISFEEFQKYFDIYKNQRYKHLQNMYSYNRKGVQSPLLQVCYRWGVFPDKLPLFIGMPTSFADAFHIHAVEWQIQLLDYLKMIGIPLDQVTDVHCKSFLQYRPIGTAFMEQKLKAVKSYIYLLQQCLIGSEQVIYLKKINIPKMIKLLYNDFLAN